MNGSCILWTKDEVDHLNCYKSSVQKIASLMVWDFISVHGIVSLHIWKGTVNALRTLHVILQNREV